MKKRKAIQKIVVLLCAAEDAARISETFGKHADADVYASRAIAYRNTLRIMGYELDECTDSGTGLHQCVVFMKNWNVYPDRIERRGHE